MQTLSVSSSMASSSSSSSSSLCLRVRASWDTQQMVSYNPNAPRKLKKPASVSANPPPPPVILSPSTAKMVETVSQLLQRQNPSPDKEPEKEAVSYLGYDRWLPTPPKVERPRAIFNAASLAYLGDCIYELHARRHFLFPPLSIEDYNDRVTAVVRCEAQDALLQKLLSDNCLTQQEREILRWGKNVGSSSKTRTKKRAGTAVYNRASSLETLIGYLYLTNTKRLEEVMQKIGFSTDSTVQFMLEQVNGKSARGQEDIAQPKLP